MALSKVLQTVLLVLQPSSIPCPGHAPAPPGRLGAPGFEMGPPQRWIFWNSKGRGELESSQVSCGWNPWWGRAAWEHQDTKWGHPPPPSIQGQALNPFPIFHSPAAHGICRWKKSLQMPDHGYSSKPLRFLPFSSIHEKVGIFPQALAPPRACVGLLQPLGWNSSRSLLLPAARL